MASFFQYPSTINRKRFVNFRKFAPRPKKMLLNQFGQLQGERIDNLPQQTNNNNDENQQYNINDQNENNTGNGIFYATREIVVGEFANDFDFRDLQAALEHVNMLYTNAKLSMKQALMYIQTLRVRFKWSNACTEAVLKMLKEMLPPNGLPKTLRTLELKLVEDTSIEVIGGNSKWNVFNIRAQVEAIMRAEWSSYCRHMKTIMECPDHYDYIGSIIRNNYANDSLNPNKRTINVCLYMDSAQLTMGSSKLQLTAILMSIIDLPPKVQKSVDNTIVAAIYVGSTKMKFDDIMPVLRQELMNLLENPIEIEQNLPICMIKIVEFIADMPARSHLLNFINHNGRYSCPICTIKGDYSTTTKSMLFLPTDEWQYRDNWPEEGFGAQEGPCHFRDIIQLPDSINCDSMHSTFIGSFKECFEWLYSEALKEFKKNADLQRFLNAIEPTIEFPNEIKRTFRCFSDQKYFKTSEWRTICLFLIPIILPILYELNDEKLNKMITSLLCLSCAMNLLHSAELLKEHINLAEVLLQQWHAHLGDAFALRFYTPKAHAHLHYAKLALQFGSPAQHNCFNFEGYMGYLDSLQTHPPTALKQITAKLKSSKQRNDYLDPLLLYELSTKEKQPNANIYELNISQRIISEEIFNFLSNEFDLSTLRAAKCVTFKHFLLCSRQFYKTKKNSIIFITNFANSLRPCLVELLISDQNREYAVVRLVEKMDPINDFPMPPMKFTKIIEGDLNGRKENYKVSHEIDEEMSEFEGFSDLMKHRYSFRNCYQILKEELCNGKLSLIDRQQIVTKGLFLNYKIPIVQFQELMKPNEKNLENWMDTRTFVMAMGTFEHD